MEAKLVVLLVSVLLNVANAASLGSSKSDVYIPPLIRNIFHKMSTVMEQGDLTIGLKYLDIVKTLHWLQPLKLDSDDNTSDGYHYTLTFNTSALQEQPTSVRLHLHTVTYDQLAVINVTIDQEVFGWRQPVLSGEDNETEVRISLGSSLINKSLWNHEIVTIKITSTVPIKLPSQHQHYHPGLLLYMGGVPEAIDDLLAKPLEKSTRLIIDDDKKKRRYVEREQCRLESFRVTFSHVGGRYSYIIQPQSLDIGRCVGECHRPYNPTEHGNILNLLASSDFKEGSATEGITPVTCTVRSFRPQPIVLYNPESRTVVYQSYNKLVAASCTCSHC